MVRSFGSGSAIRVKCSIGRTEFNILWKGIKNSENLCSRCPIHRRCKGRVDYRFKIFEHVRVSPDVHTYEVII